MNGNPFDFIKLGGPAAIIAIIVLLAVFGLAFWWGIRRRWKKPASEAFAASRAPVISTAKSKSDKRQDSTQKPLIGTGAYKAVVFRKDGAIDFTTIPEPLGQVHQVDTSCPQPGSCYTVIEGAHGEIIDYDTREIPIITEELPEWAFFAINCREIVRRFWQVPLAWWRSTSIWFAAGMILVVFICFLAVFGG